jgi:hypothetical protein
MSGGSCEFIDRKRAYAYRYEEFAVAAFAVGNKPD